MQKFIKRVIPIFLAVVLIIGTTVIGVNASTDSYKENFINKLLKNQSLWDYGKNEKFYFSDIDLDGNLELMCERDVDSHGNSWVEVFGFSDGEIFKYYNGKAQTGNMQTYILDNFSLYYDTNNQKYRWFSLTSDKNICCDISYEHNCYSNYEVAVYDKKIYKDYFTAYCSENGYYEFFRKGDVELGYIPGSYNYNISGPNDDIDFYNKVNTERLNGLKEVNLRKEFVYSSDLNSCNSNEKRKILEKAYDGFRYDYKIQDTTTPIINEPVDYSKYNPIKFLGMSFNEITNMFGNDYIEVDEPETGLDKCIAYPNTGNPFELLIDYDTNIVKYVWIYDISETSIKLFDDITNKSTLADIEKSTTSYTYSKWVGENIFNGNNVEQYVTYKIKDGIAFRLEWTTNDFDNQSANRVLVFQSEDEVIPAETTESISVETTKPTATSLEIKPTNSTDVTSKISTKDTATSDSVNNDNGTIQTGAISIAVIIFLILASLATGGFVWYRRKIK